ncbi:aminotransferase class I/II-fold pyridoxal phosphate-dependent enzyme [Azospirillum sp. ST 5-10]|uniref:aminotransferase class I/II-fold pyridoxal phosphate-dependent enzyme n=1 Tax=unclassified Azospirillum TaxID=2630922 RepID=UPI003F4A30C1
MNRPRAQDAAPPKLQSIPFYHHDLGRPELEAVARVLEGPILTTGSEVAEVERRLAALLGRRHAIAVTSCTGAMHMALMALGVGPGDEVITTPMTFVATAAAILEAGATPVFADVEPATGNLDAAAVAAAVTPRTRAIIPVHLYGAMCDMRALRAIADRHGLALIEDSAHCIEGRRDGVRPGELSAAACFSFYATKNLTCGEGGALVTDDDALHERLLRLRLHGIDRSLADRHASSSGDWDMVAMGWKYNMSNIEAALLLPQMDRLDRNYARRDRLARLYERRLAGLPGVRLPERAPDTVHAWHLFPVWIDGDRRDETLRRLRTEGIGCVVNYRPVHLTRHFRETFGFAEGAFPNAERIGRETLSLPFYPAMPDEHVEMVVEALADCLGAGGRRAAAPEPSDAPAAAPAPSVPAAASASVSSVLQRLVAEVPGFSDFDELVALHALAMGNAGVAGDVIEIGSWCGRSTVALALAARVIGARVHAIDLFPERAHWQRNDDGSWSIRTTVDGRPVNAYQDQTVWAAAFHRAVSPVYDQGEVFDQFRATLDRFGVADIVTPHRGSSEDFRAKAPADLRCRLAFIDGDHGTEAVCRDVAAVEPFCSDGALVCFDDAFSGHYPQVDRAIHECILENPRYHMTAQITRKLFVARRRGAFP